MDHKKGLCNNNNNTFQNQKKFKPIKRNMKIDIEKDESFKEDKGYSPDNDEESNF
jgi:hypothetical protein